MLDVAQRFHDEQVNVSLIVVGALASLCHCDDTELSVHSTQISLRGSIKATGISLFHLISTTTISKTMIRSFDPTYFPDPASMAAKVKELTGAEMMVSLWPSVEDLSVNYIEMQQKGLLVTTRDGTGITDSFAGVYTRLIDSTNPAAREFLCELEVSFSICLLNVLRNGWDREAVE